VKNDTSQEDIDTMVKSLNDLNNAPELSSLLIQITAGKLVNLCSIPRCYSFERHDLYLHPEFPTIHNVKRIENLTLTYCFGM
jgi:hypothetical protein